MPAASPFSEKLGLVLKALSMSRGRLASELGVDKSLVGRWVSGAITPSSHNLENLTRLLAGKRDGFTMLDWERDLPGLASLFGVEAAEPPSAPMANVLDTLFMHVLNSARAATGLRAGVYEGFWRTTVPAPDSPVILMTFHGLIRRDADGLLLVRVGCAGLLYEGRLLLAEGKIFGMLMDRGGATPVSMILNAVSMPKAMRLDGLALLALVDVTRTPMAVPVICERIGDLTGDAEADDATCADLLTRGPILEPGELSPEIQARLVRDIGPAAMENGGEILLLSSLSSALSLGVLA